jgi:hypothetical protein
MAAGKTSLVSHLLSAHDLREELTLLLGRDLIRSASSEPAAATSGSAAGSAAAGSASATPRSRRSRVPVLVDADFHKLQDPVYAALMEKGHPSASWLVR